MLLQRAVTRDGVAVRLTPTEWGILALLVRHPGKLITQQHLLSAVWGPAYEKETNYLRVYMAQLRRKLEADPVSPRQLLTEPGIGYRVRALMPAGSAGLTPMNKAWVEAVC